MNEYVEAIFIEIKKNLFDTKKDFIIGVIYRPPNTDIDKFLEVMNDWLAPISREKSLNFYLGDFNINSLSYSIHNTTTDFIDINVC